MSTPIVVDVAAGNNRTIRSGSVGCGVVGGFFLISGVIATATRSVGVGALSIAIGLLAIGLGLLPLVRKEVFLRPRRFFVDGTAIRWEDPKGAPWSLPWADLSAVLVSTSGPRETRDATGAPNTYAALVRVDFYPHNPGAHPEIAHLWQFDNVKNAYRVPLGPNPDLIPQLDHAFRTFTPAGVYRGVVQGDGGLF